MQDLLKDHHFEKLDSLGIVTILVPYPYQINGTTQEQAEYAAAYLKTQYNFNWSGSALLLGFNIVGNRIVLNFMNSEVLQVILADTGLGDDLFSEFADLVSKDLYGDDRATDVFDGVY